MKRASGPEMVKQLRKALRARFPGQKFRLNSRFRESRVSVRWAGGPKAGQVQQVVSGFQCVRFVLVRGLFSWFCGPT